jgi:hypothetical protein
MIAGALAGQIYMNLYQTDPNLFGQLPSDADGPSTPGANQPNVLTAWSRAALSLRGQGIYVTRRSSTRRRACP